MRQIAMMTGFSQQQMWRFATGQHSDYPHEIEEWLDKLIAWLKENPPPQRDEIYE